MEFCVTFASILKISNCIVSFAKIWFLLTCFHQILSCPEVFDETKDQKIIHKDMKDSWNSVLDLLVYSKCPIK